MGIGVGGGGLKQLQVENLQQSSGISLEMAGVGPSLMGVGAATRELSGNGGWGSPFS